MVLLVALFNKMTRTGRVSFLLVDIESPGGKALSEKALLCLGSCVVFAVLCLILLYICINECYALFWNGIKCAYAG